MARRVGRLLKRQGLLEGDSDNSYLAADAVDEVSIKLSIRHKPERLSTTPQTGDCSNCTNELDNGTWLP